MTIPSGKIIPALSWAARLAKSIGSIAIVYGYVDIKINFLILSVIVTTWRAKFALISDVRR